MLKRLVNICVWLFAISTAFASISMAATEKRVALVIGNSAYENAVQLANPQRDAKAVAEKLRSLGFVVVEGYDLTHETFEDTIKDFSKAVRGASIGMVYYAGHGMQVHGQNYLIPIDAAFKDASALDFEAIPMDLVTRQMQLDVAVRLVILDACRDNPLAQLLSRSMSTGTRSTAVPEGLAEIKLGDAGEGTAIIFATSPDQVALDGDGDHSPFTTALLKNIGAPDTDLQVVMSRVTGDVYASTKQQQRPWINASLTGPVLLNPQKKVDPAATVDPAPASTASGSSDTLQRETVLYNLARETGLKEDYEAYLEQFPNGLFSANARKQIARLEQAGPSTTIASAPVTDTSGGSPSVARSVAPALELPITDVVKAMVSNQATENDLKFDADKRAEIQTRLKLAGYFTGSPDGSFKKKTRAAVQNWQTSLGLTPSGFFNQPQYEILTQQTEAKYAAYSPEDVSPAKSAAVSKSKVVQKRRDRREGPVSGRRRGGGGSEEFGRFLGGVVRGAIRF